MAGFLVEAAQAIRGLQCQVLGANEYIVGSIGRYAGPVRDRALDGINATRRLLGCDPEDDPTEPPPPFTGGQCPTLPYQVTFNWTVEGGLPPEQTTGVRARGPIGSASFIDVGGTNRIQISLGSAPTLGFECGAVTNAAPVQLYTLTPVIDINAEGLTQTVTPCGHDDSCGNPPPVYPPPTNIEIDVDVTYQPDFGPEVTVPITVEFSPTTVNFNGDVAFPFNFDFGGFNFTGNLNFTPEVNVTINPPLVLPRGTDQPTDELPPQDDPQPVPPAEADQIIIGVAVQSVVVGEQQFTSIATQGMPNIFAPRAGSVKFAYSVGVSTFWSPDIDIKGPNTFIPCPFSQGADAVVASPAPGVAVNWRPVYGFPLATVQDLLDARQA